MSISANISTDLFANFDSIDLSALESKAAMLERIDKKYIVSYDDLSALLTVLRDHFDILEIGAARRFTYDTRYFDGDHYETYQDHLRGRRKRVKVRIRRYAHSGQCFLEVKLKDRRSMTIKHRKTLAHNQFESLDHDALEFVHEKYTQAYHRDLNLNLTPALDVRYDRITLIAKQGGERLTIDGNLHFSVKNAEMNLTDPVFIVETKSRNGNGMADWALRRLHQHPTKHCSKYCIGLGIVNPNLKINPFRPAIRKLLGRHYNPLYEML